ncbi:MAG: endonuclease/exonuclease/phosphatase family protein [Luteibaculaceae bacterium]
MKKLALLIPALILALIAQISAQLPQFDASKQYVVAGIGFYNVENLFDTINSPGINDVMWTPEGDNQWNTFKYFEKLDRLAEVIQKMGKEATPDGLAIIGLAEVENEVVVQDLVNQPRIKDKNYQVIHFYGPDRRGIDVALIYQPKYFKVTDTKTFTLTNPENPRFKTRDQLLVSGDFLGERMHVIVAHWPSRRGGEKRSKPLRALAADLSKSIIDSIVAAEPNAKVVFMGDLNDDPTSPSLKINMRSKDKVSQVTEGSLFNTMGELYKKGVGTLAWRDSWNLFDQILVTPAFVSGDYSGFQYHKSRVFNPPFMRQKSGRFEGYPWRSYGFGNYIGGYSDHFPTYFIMLKEVP